MNEHNHGKISRTLCWIGLHPRCCQSVRGLAIQSITCLSCGRWDVA